MALELRTVVDAVAESGLAYRGGFQVAPEDAVPPFPDGRPAATLLLFGNRGSDLWPVFSASPEAGDGRPDPLNRWSQRLLCEIAAATGGMAHFPFGGPPYVPFLRWAQRAEHVAPSPLGMLIHPRYGLWHAYRGALAFAEDLALPPLVNEEHPCESCADRPCLTACPVAAFRPDHYDVAACVDHIKDALGVDCMSGSCLARRACPIGRDFTYTAPHARFHMEAFLRARLAAADEEGA